jgi:hypothetical protein
MDSQPNQVKARGLPTRYWNISKEGNKGKGLVECDGKGGSMNGVEVFHKEMTH